MAGQRWRRQSAPRGLGEDRDGNAFYDVGLGGAGAVFRSDGGSGPVVFAQQPRGGGFHGGEPFLAGLGLRLVDFRDLSIEHQFSGAAGTEFCGRLDSLRVFPVPAAGHLGSGAVVSAPLPPLGRGIRVCPPRAPLRSVGAVLCQRVLPAHAIGAHRDGALPDGSAIGGDPRDPDGCAAGGHWRGGDRLCVSRRHRGGDLDRRAAGPGIDGRRGLVSGADVAATAGRGGGDVRHGVRSGKIRAWRLRSVAGRRGDLLGGVPQWLVHQPAEFRNRSKLCPALHRLVLGDRGAARGVVGRPVVCAGERGVFPDRHLVVRILPGPSGGLGRGARHGRRAAARARGCAARAWRFPAARGGPCG